MVFLGEISVIGMKTQLDSCLHFEWLLKGLKRRNMKAVDAHERKED